MDHQKQKLRCGHNLGASSDHVYITNIILPMRSLLAQAPVVKLNYFLTTSALPQSVTTIAMYADMPVRYSIHCTHLFFYSICIYTCCGAALMLSRSTNRFSSSYLLEEPQIEPAVDIISSINNTPILIYRMVSLGIPVWVEIGCEYPALHVQQQINRHSAVVVSREFCLLKLSNWTPITRANCTLQMMSAQSRVQLWALKLVIRKARHPPKNITLRPMSKIAQSWLPSEYRLAHLMPQRQAKSIKIMDWQATKTYDITLQNQPQAMNT